MNRGCLVVIVVLLSLGCLALGFCLKVGRDANSSRVQGLVGYGLRLDNEDGVYLANYSRWLASRLPGKAIPSNKTQQLGVARQDAGGRWSQNPLLSLPAIFQ
jgi:hypothetical protein